jgi:hypothetical protein
MDTQRESRSGRVFPLNTSVPVYDLPGAFKRSENEEGTYHVQRGGQTWIATARRGSSLESLTPAGPPVPVAGAILTNEPFIVTCVSDEPIKIGSQQSQGQSRDNR